MRDPKPAPASPASPMSSTVSSASNAPTAISSPSSSALNSPTTAAPPAPTVAKSKNTITDMTLLPYHLSPVVLDRLRCACNEPRRTFTTATDILNYTLSRLDKVWKRLTGHAPPAELQDAAFRTMITLRSFGYEFAHLVAYEGESKMHGKKNRIEACLVFMTPDQDEPSAHRPNAQILVHYTGHLGMEKLENVAVRFAQDWEDWTVVQPHEYVPDDSAPRPNKVVLLSEGLGPSGEAVQGVFDGMWDTIVQRLGGRCDGRKSDFVRKLSRAIEEMRGEGWLLSSYEVGAVIRQSRISTKSVPALKISLYVIPLAGPSEISETERNGLVKQADPPEHVGAVVLLDITDTRAAGQRVKLKHISVVYDGEWPIAHHYRNTIPPPTLTGLEMLVREAKRDE